MSRILVTESLSDDGLALLRERFQVDQRKGLSTNQLIEEIRGYGALLVRSETQVTAAVLQAGTDLKVIARAGVGTDNIDVQAATRLGKLVVNSPTGNIQAAAEHTIALLLSLARKVPQATASVKAGLWQRSSLVGVEVSNKTLGILGLGKVGLIVARLARGLGMNVIAADPFASDSVAQAANVKLVASLSDLLPHVHFLTIHTPMLSSTKGIISSAELGQMRKGSYVLNVARGGIIDEAALLDALESGHIAGAGIDVFSKEPIPFTDASSTLVKLVQHKNCIATPHLGASTVEAQEMVSVDVCEQVIRVLDGHLPRSAVNMPILVPAEHKKLQPFVKLVEKMGSLYTQFFAAAQFNQRHSYDLIYEGDIAALSNTKPLYAAFIKGLLSPVQDENTTINMVNAELVAQERGIKVTETRSRGESGTRPSVYSSLVTLIVRPPPPIKTLDRLTADLPSSTKSSQHILSGYCAEGRPFIVRIDQFACSFEPRGQLIFCKNTDKPGRIGSVGSLLGQNGVNIESMSVGPELASYRTQQHTVNLVRPDTPMDRSSGALTPNEESAGEALMILSTHGKIDEELVKEIGQIDGILAVHIVSI